MRRALGMAAGQLVHTKELGGGRSMLQETPRHQLVVQDQVGFRQALDGAQRQQARISRAGTDQKHAWFPQEARSLVVIQTSIISSDSGTSMSTSGGRGDIRASKMPSS